MSGRYFILRVILRGLKTAPSNKDCSSHSHSPALVEYTQLVLRERS